MKLIYINIGLSSVFDSQVVELLKYYCENDEFNEVILLFGWKHASEIEIVKKKLDNSKINLLFFKAYPNYPVFSTFTIKSISKELDKITDPEDHIIHIRGEVSGYYALNSLKRKRVKYRNIIVDIRGASIEEIDLYSPLPDFLKKIKIKFINKAMRFLKQNNIKISVVSNSLKEYLILKGFKRDLIYINHCMAAKRFTYDQEIRDNKRKELGLAEDELCIVFSSAGSARWQNDQIMNNIINLNEKLRILNLSKHVIQHPRIINKFVPYQEVSDYLCAADYGLVCRDDNTVNAVSCPVKLVEYLCTGLPVIHNNTINLIKDYEEFSDLAVDVAIIPRICDLSNNTSRYSGQLPAQRLFHQDIICKNYQDLYVNEDSNSM